MKAIKYLFLATLAVFIIAAFNSDNKEAYTLAFILALISFIGFMFSIYPTNKPINRISHFPKKVKEMMLINQAKQGNKMNLKVFEVDEFSQKDKGGFDWGDTPEGYLFWQRVILNEDFDIIYNAKFAKKRTNN